MALVTAQVCHCGAQIEAPEQSITSIAFVAPELGVGDLRYMFAQKLRISAETRAR